MTQGRPVSATSAGAGGVALGILTGVIEVGMKQPLVVDFPSLTTLAYLAWLIWKRQRSSMRLPLVQIGTLLIGYGLGWVLIDVDVPALLPLAMLLCGLLTLGLAQIRHIAERRTL
jgi:hypothetical protein